MLILRQVVAGVEYVDLEVDIAAQLPRFGKTKRIMSYHNFKETPENLLRFIDELAALNCLHREDRHHGEWSARQSPMLTRSSDGELPTVAFCMGELGQASRILAGKFVRDSRTRRSIRDRAMAPGQLSYEQMQSVYHYEEIDTTTDVFGVIADPVGHSLSPEIHNAAFRDGKLNRVYVPFRVPPREFRSLWDTLVN